MLKQTPLISALDKGHFLLSLYVLALARLRTNRSVPLVVPKSMLGYKGGILPSSRSPSKTGMLELPLQLVVGHFLSMEWMC